MESLVAFLGGLLAAPIISGLMLFLLQRPLEGFFKRRELLDEQVVANRAVIAARVIELCRNFQHMPLSDFVKSGDELYSQVLCWFPDGQCTLYRDFLATVYRDPSMADTSWQKDIEPLLASLVEAVRPESKQLKCKPVTMGESSFRFLPRPRIKPSPRQESDLTRVE